jgi:hypothetical protein
LVMFLLGLLYKLGDVASAEFQWSTLRYNPQDNSWLLNLLKIESRSFLMTT